MAIFPGSRYESATVVRLPDSAGVLNPTVIPSGGSLTRFQYTQRLVVDGDRIDQIAAEEYGDPGLWWYIANANPEIRYWDALPPYAVLRIPVVV